MKKSFKKFPYLFLGLISSVSYASVCSGGLGTQNFSNIILDCISNTGTVNLSSSSVNGDVHNTGNLKLSSSTILGSTYNVGTLKADNSKLNNINITGNVSLSNNSIITGISYITGILNSNKSQLSSIIINSDNIAITDSIVKGNIEVNPSDQNKNIQKLYLSSSQVNGDITFTGGNGEITIENSSTVTGKITGANIIKK